MIKRLIPIKILLLALLFSCGVPEQLENFDSETWKNDRYGCSEKRKPLVADIDGIRDALYGKKEYMVRNLFGKPDRENLLERNQRIYYYYIESGIQCDNRSAPSDANRLEIRINSTGKVSEIGFKEPL